ncbi:vomeronasal type-1 receptor 4-like [Callospermophilus lateralis]|uniref:vomeronasal type-1 receptor 4-like n=1 Tax=Callospermophilus lateralis TaxID=76772 RepID=UPI004053EBE3
MAASDVAVGIISLSQTVVGALGNSSLLLHYVVLYFTGYRVRHTDLILQHLIVANLLALLCRGVPQTMSGFGMKYFTSGIDCKLLFGLHKVGRNMSMWSTCLLSIFQAIKISSGNSRWVELKMKAPRYIISCIYLSWVLYLLLNVINFMYMTAKKRNKTITNVKDYGYCSSVRHDPTADSLYAALLTFPDAMCMGLMLWASSSMVLILHRHKQRMQHVHKTSSSRCSPESRATKTILLLVSTFVSFYTLSCIFQVCISAMYTPSWFVVNAGFIIAGCFPAVSPFLLMSRDYSVSGLWFTWIQNRGTRDVTGKM